MASSTGIKFVAATVVGVSFIKPILRPRQS